MRLKQPAVTFAQIMERNRTMKVSTLVVEPIPELLAPLIKMSNEGYKKSEHMNRLYSHFNNNRRVTLTGTQINSYKVNNSFIKMGAHQKIFRRCTRRKVFHLSDHKCSTWISLDTTRTLTGTRFCGQRREQHSKWTEIKIWSEMKLDMVENL